MLSRSIFTIFLFSTLIQVYGASTTELPFMNEQQRQLFEELKSIDTKIPSSQYDIPQESKEMNVTVTDGGLYPVKEIVLHNNTLLSPKEVHEIVSRYIDRSQGIRGLSALAKELTNCYIEHGYITSRVYLTPQDISDGVVDLYAIEGKIEKILTDNRKTLGAFIGLEGENLDLVNLESALEQVNRLRSNRTTMNLLPGKETGGSTIMLNTQESSPFFGSFGVNNFGSSATGKYQVYAGFTWENFFGLSDMLSLNVNTTDQHQSGKNSIGNGVTYGIPVGKWLWEGGISRFRYEQTIAALNENYLSQGVSDLKSLGTMYKLHHTRTYNLELNGKVTHKNNENWINGARIESSSYDLTVGDIGVKYVYRQPSWEVYLLGNYHHGMNWYSPTVEGELKHDFSKSTLAIGGTKYFDASVNYQFSGYAQYSDDPLYSIEQISIGGSYSVRGFQKQSINGSSGGYMRNDFVFSPQSLFSPYIAYDIGWIRHASDTAGGRLSSATLGFHSGYKGWSIDFYHALPLTSPDDTFGTDPFIGVTLSVNF